MDGARGFFVFFFQAEDGIRDLTVTGVQTCALPISTARQRRTARARGGEQRPDYGGRRFICHAQTSVRRDPKRAEDLHGDHRHRVKPGLASRALGQGRSYAASRYPANRPRQGDEPGGPPARLRRRQAPDRIAVREDEVGEARHGSENAQKAQGIKRAHRYAQRRKTNREITYVTKLEKGYVHGSETPPEAWEAQARG